MKLHIEFIGGPLDGEMRLTDTGSDGIFDRTGKGRVAGEIWVPSPYIADERNGPRQDHLYRIVERIDEPNEILLRLRFAFSADILTSYEYDRGKTPPA